MFLMRNLCLVPLLSTICISCEISSAQAPTAKTWVSPELYRKGHAAYEKEDYVHALSYLIVFKEQNASRLSSASLTPAEMNFRDQLDKAIRDSTIRVGGSSSGGGQS
jgi:outer membrane protein assembly factor BamD (BamD/ComL family)